VDIPVDSSSLVVERLGEWPSFHDNYVVDPIHHRGETVEFQIHTWLVDRQGWKVNASHHLVGFRCDGVTAVSLNGLTETRELYRADFLRTASGGVRVEFEPVYGPEMATIKCRKVSVVSMRRCSEHGEPAGDD